MTIRRTPAMVVAILALSAGFAAFRQSQPVQARDQEPAPIGERVSFGMAGITAGQTMRLSVVNMWPPGPTYPPGPSRVAMAFRGVNGQLLRSARTAEVIRRVVDLQRGESAFLDLDYDELPPGPSRLQLRAVLTVQYPPGPTSELPPSPIVPSVEVINNVNGRTQFVISNPGVLRGFNPQPDPPLE
jgi:hypothetical protein